MMVNRSCCNFPQCACAPDNLLEGGHGLNALIEHDELAGLGVHTGIEQP